MYSTRLEPRLTLCLGFNSIYTCMHVLSLYLHTLVSTIVVKKIIVHDF